MSSRRTAELRHVPSACRRQVTTGFASWLRYCTAFEQWAPAKLCGVKQTVPAIYSARRPSRWALAYILVFNSALIHKWCRLRCCQSPKFLVEGRRGINITLNDLHIPSACRRQLTILWTCGRQAACSDEWTTRPLHSDRQSPGTDTDAQHPLWFNPPANNAGDISPFHWDIASGRV